jgi:hypothetical protein
MVRTIDMLCKETGHSAVQEAKIRTVFYDFFVKQEQLRPQGVPDAGKGRRWTGSCGKWI